MGNGPHCQWEGNAWGYRQVGWRVGKLAYGPLRSRRPRSKPPTRLLQGRWHKETPSMAHLRQFWQYCGFSTGSGNCLLVRCRGKIGRRSLTTPRIGVEKARCSVCASSAQPVHSMTATLFAPESAIQMRPLASRTMCRTSDFGDSIGKRSKACVFGEKRIR